MLKAKINRLKKKGFRDAYVRSHLTHGLAHQIRTLRNQRGWTQEELAQKLGVKTQSAIARMEDPSYGRLSIATLLKLGSAFDVALSVRFLSYGKFLLEKEDVSSAALSAESFENEAPRIIKDMDGISNYSKVHAATSTNNEFYRTPTPISGGSESYNTYADIGTGWDK